MKTIEEVVEEAFTDGDVHYSGLGKLTPEWLTQTLKAHDEELLGEIRKFVSDEV